MNRMIHKLWGLPKLKKTRLLMRSPNIGQNKFNARRTHFCERIRICTVSMKSNDCRAPPEGRRKSRSRFYLVEGFDSKTLIFFFIPSLSKKKETTAVKTSAIGKLHQTRSVT